MVTKEMESIIGLIETLTQTVGNIQRSSIENDKALLALMKELIEKIIRIEERIISIETQAQEN